MSHADKLFKNMCNTILNEGTDTKGEKVRTIWNDTNEPAYTIKTFGVTDVYDLRKEFPALTLRPTGIKSAMDEILWIFQKKSNNIKDLKPHIWDEWADEKGSIGKAYGYQIGKQFLHHKFTYNKNGKSLRDYSVEHMIGENKTYEDMIKEYPSVMFVYDFNEQKGGKITISVYMDQMDAVLYDLKNNPFSRRIITSLWNVDELHEMNLQPCCWNCTFNVTDEGNDKLVLNMVLNQRSNDVLAANNWNVVQYSLLLMMIAQVCNMEAGKLLHVITDAHIYDRHVDIIKDLITREEYDAPIVTLNKDIKNFYDFTTDDVNIENYKFGEKVKNIPIAV